jgi:hypothetical protein
MALARYSRVTVEEMFDDRGRQPGHHVLPVAAAAVQPRAGLLAVSGDSSLAYLLAIAWFRWRG